MVCFDEKEQIVKYSTVDQIIDSFCKIRLGFYTKRKQYQLSSMKSTLKSLSNKMKFVQGVIDNKIKIMNKKEDEINAHLTKEEFDMQDNSFGYLLSLQVRTFTSEKVSDLKKEIEVLQGTIQRLTKKSEKQLWLSDLEDFENQYKKFLNN